jgi:alpha-glucosidase
LLRMSKHNALEENPESLVFGELSFDTSPTLRQHTLDGSMHYAGFAHPVMDWLCGKTAHGWDVQVSTQELWQTLWAHYAALPLQLRHSMYTLIGSHDIPRPLWRLRGNIERYKLALGLLFTFPGAPAIYYGDEIGLDQTNSYSTFNGDPMCRGTFPWDTDAWNHEVLEYTRKLIGLKKSIPALKHGSLRPLEATEHLLSFKRIYEGEEVWVYAPLKPTQIQLPKSKNLLSGKTVEGPHDLVGLGIFKLL